METIEETTVGLLEGHRVAMASMIHEGQYLLPDGTIGKGLSCVLVPIKPQGDDVWVGLGSQVEFGGTTWQVTELHKPDNGNGEIRLRKIGNEFV